MIAILAGAVLANAAQEHTDKSQHVGGLVTLYIASKNILLINNFNGWCNQVYTSFGHYHDITSWYSNI